MTASGCGGPQLPHSLVPLMELWEEELAVFSHSCRKLVAGRGLRAVKHLSVAVIAAAWMALGAPVASAAPEPFSGEGIAYPDSLVAPLSVMGNCDPYGTSTLQYTASGVLTDGAYPGPWTETGTIEIGPQTSIAGFPLNQQVTRSGRVTGYEAEFTVNSPEGLISGTKRFEDADEFDAQAVCQELVNQFVPARGGPPLSGSFYWARISGGQYAVTLTRPEGVFTGKRAFANTFLQIERYDEFQGHPFIAGGLMTSFFRAFWAPPVPASVSLSPADAMLPTGSTHTVTATALDGAGEPLPDVPMRFRAEGTSGGRTGDCVTGSTGACDFSFSGPAPYETSFEVQSITAWADVDEDGVQGASEISAAASVTFVGPTDADSDGIRDDVDSDPLLASTTFSDTDGTSGSIVDRAGLDVTIADEPAPDGVRVTVGAGERTR